MRAKIVAEEAAYLTKRTITHALQKQNANLSNKRVVFSGVDWKIEEELDLWWDSLKFGVDLVSYT